MTLEEIRAMEAANPGLTRAQYAAIASGQAPAPNPSRPDVSGSMVLNPPPANYATPPPGTPPPSTPPPPTTTTTTPPPGGWTNQQAQDYFNQLFPGQTLSPQMLADNEAALNAHGIKLKRNAAGQATAIYLPDGTIVDPIIGAGSGQNQKAWQVKSGPGGDTTGYGGGGGNPWGAMGQFLGSLGYNVGGSFAPWTQNWSTPTEQQALNYPGVQFAMNNAMRLMENNAAAQGVLGNARAQEQISQNLGQSLLGQYQNIRGMALGDYQQQQQDFFANQDRPWQKFMQGANLGAQAAGGS